MMGDTHRGGVMESKEQTTRAQSRSRSVAGNVIRGSIGNLVEWYDWYAYTAFSVYFATAFFSSRGQTAQLLNTAAVFAVGFLMRPVGGWLWAATPTATAGEPRSRCR